MNAPRILKKKSLKTNEKLEAFPKKTVQGTKIIMLNKRQEIDKADCTTLSLFVNFVLLFLFGLNMIRDSESSIISPKTKRIKNCLKKDCKQ